MQRFLPMLARVRAKLLGNVPLAECASEIVELAPAVDREQPAAISLPGEFDRVLAVQEETTLAIERERLTAGKRRHGPTIAYRIDNAVLGEKTLYYKGGYEVLRGGSKRPLLLRDSDGFTEMQLCSNYVVDRYFGHWLTDGLCLELLAEQRSLPALTPARAPWTHEADYRQLSGLKAVKSNHARVERLWVIDDRGVNDGWISRVVELRRRVCLAAGRKRSKRVMLARGRLGTKRSLVNSAEVHEALERLGFEIVHPESETPRNIVEKLSGVEIAISVEGSAQDHFWLAVPVQSTVIAIQPPTRFNAYAKSRADAIGVNWAYVVADVHADGFYLPINRLLRTISEAERVAGARA
jgi:hypothetical protein